MFGLVVAFLLISIIRSKSVEEQCHGQCLDQNSCGAWLENTESKSGLYSVGLKKGDFAKLEEIFEEIVQNWKKIYGSSNKKLQFLIKLENSRWLKLIVNSTLKIIF